MLEIIGPAKPLMYPDQIFCYSPIFTTSITCGLQTIVLVIILPFHYKNVHAFIS